MSADSEGAGTTNGGEKMTREMMRIVLAIGFARLGLLLVSRCDDSDSQRRRHRIL
jgi:hypothetical protein